MTIVFDNETIKTINLFETVSQGNVKDCIIMDDRIYFLVEEQNLEKIRENAQIIKKLEKMLNKKILIFEYSKDVSKFLKNSIKGIKGIKIRNGKESTTIEINVENSLKSLVIGKDGKNIKALRQFLKRNYNVDNLEVK
jgi:NusA-like KH domain protein